MLILFSGINNSFYCDITKGEIEIGQIAVVRAESVVTTIVARRSTTSDVSWRKRTVVRILNPLKFRD